MTDDMPAHLQAEHVAAILRRAEAQPIRPTDVLWGRQLIEAALAALNDAAASQAGQPDNPVWGPITEHDDAEEPANLGAYPYVAVYWRGVGEWDVTRPEGVAWNSVAAYRLPTAAGMGAP